MKTIAFAGSNSSKSINKALINHVANLIEGTEILNLSDYDVPMYSFDIEQTDGIPTAVKNLDEKLASADKLIISLAEHNGNFSAFFKNHLDWLSRNNRGFLKDKKVLLLSTSPGGMGGSNVINIAKNTLPHFGANIVAIYNFGNFYDVFQEGKVVNEKIAQELQQVAQDFASK